MTTAADERDPIEALADQFVLDCRRGAQPTIEAYVQAHPELADRIRALFPTIAALEAIKQGSSSSPPVKGLPADQHTLGDFEILGELGRGGMGVVYDALDRSLGRSVAVKVLPTSGRSATTRERFRREAQVAARLHHTNIVPVFATGEQAGYSFFVMQRIAGTSIDQVIALARERPAPPGSSAANNEPDGDAPWKLGPGRAEEFGRGVVAWLSSRSPGGHPDDSPAAGFSGNRAFYARIAQIGIQIAAALEHAHEQGILHRDVKPSNLLLDVNGTAWITDFGLAKLNEHDDLTVSGDIVGTLRYLAPEQTNGQCDARTDLYGLGLALYELTALRPAFAGRSKRQVVQRILAGDLMALRSIDPQVPADLAMIIAKACALDPADRYQTATDLRLDLERFNEGRAIAARRASWVEVSWRWCKRNRLTAALAGCVLLGLLLTGIAGWVAFGMTSDALEGERGAKLLVDDNLRLSLQAFDDVFLRVSGPDPTSQSIEDPETGEITMLAATPISTSGAELLQLIAQFYEKFAARNSGQAALRWEAARANRRVGDIEHRLGRPVESERAYRRALEQHEALAEQPPRITSERALELAVAHNGLGRILALKGDTGAAEEQHRRSVDLLTNVKEGAVDLAKHELARTHILLGHLFAGPSLGNSRSPRQTAAAPTDRSPQPAWAEQRRGRRSEQRAASALSNCQSALDILLPLLEQSPRNGALRLLIAQTHRVLAYAQRDDQRANSQALAIQEFEGLVQEFPDADQYQFELAETLLPEPGERIRTLDLPKIERAVELSEKLVKAHPTISDYRATHTRARFLAGIAHLAAGSPEFGHELARAALATQFELTRRWTTLPLVEQPRHLLRLSWMVETLYDSLRQVGEIEAARQAAAEAATAAAFLEVDPAGARIVQRFLDLAADSRRHR